ncbi:MAG: hypothetical protein ACE5FP_02565 [Gemmatimonadota bacterium]
MVLLALVSSAVLARSDPAAFRVLAREDGPIEWLAVVGYVLIGGLWLHRAVSLRSHRPALFVSLAMLYGLVFLSFAAEEISWGQRIFAFESGEFFERHNDQRETNLHNLVLDGTSVNRVLSKVAALVGVIYALVLPVVYESNIRLRKWIDRLAIPVPRLRQVVAILLVGLLVALTPSRRNHELTESALPFIVLLVFLYPRNEALFRRHLHAEPATPSAHEIL